MKNANEYQHFLKLLELDAKDGLFFHHVEERIYVTDATYRLLGIWDLEKGAELDKSNFRTNTSSPR